MAAGTMSFDVVGTLFSLDAPRRVLSDHGAPPSSFEVSFSGALRDYFARSHSGAYMPLKDVLENTLERAARMVDWELDEGWPGVDAEPAGTGTAEGAGAGLGRLDQAGWKKIAVTNSSRELADVLLARSGLAAHFETVISWDDLREQVTSAGRQRGRETLEQRWLARCGACMGCGRSDNGRHEEDLAVDERAHLARLSSHSGTSRRHPRLRL